MLNRALRRFLRLLWRLIWRGALGFVVLSVAWCCYFALFRHRAPW